MRKLLLLLPLVLGGCSGRSPEEAEAAKYPQPKMMSDAEAKALEASDARKGGAIPRPPGETEK